VTEVHVKGLKELGEFLKTLEPKLRNNVMRAALRQGANVIKESVLQNVPVAPPNTENARLYGAHTGSLRDSVRVGSRVRRDGKVVAYVRAGGKKDAYYAHMVEFGTRPHKIGKVGRMLWINGRWVYAPVNHPGSRPRPFMRPAADSTAQTATVAVGNKIKSILETKHGLDTPVSIEGVENED
jgi:HK97 gp10 family phage protein